MSGKWNGMVVGFLKALTGRGAAADAPPEPDWDALEEDAHPAERGPVASKLRAARREAGRGAKPLPERSSSRLPPGQVLTSARPVLDLGRRPDVDPAAWRLALSRDGRRVADLDLPALLALGVRETTSDIHCVTRWSRFDNRWLGVPVAEVLRAAGLDASEGWAVARGADGYATSLPVTDLLDPRATLATHWDGLPLTREHGAPVRLVVPHLYFWKSAKWIVSLGLTDGMERGFWEAGAYHDRGDPWLEQRFRGHGRGADRRGLPPEVA